MESSAWNTAERSGLNLPVPDWIGKEADAIVEGLFGPDVSRAEVIHSHSLNFIGMK